MARQRTRTLRTAAIGERVWLGGGLWARKTRTKGIVYGIQYTVDNQLVRETIGSDQKGTTRAFARAVLKKRLGEIAAGTFGLKDARKKTSPTVAAFAETYLEHAKQNKRSWKRDAGVMEKVKTFMGFRRLDKVSTWDVERYKAARRETGITGASVNRELAILKRALTLAVTWGLIEKNPAAGVKLFKENERPIHALTRDEQAALVDACRGSHLFPIVVTALNTGMRRGELFNLRWDDVDLVARVVTVKQSKSGRVRHIPLNTAVVDALADLEDREGFVFTFRGEQIETVRRSFLGAIERAGIRTCRFHDLRHTFATNLVLGGVDLVTVKELMGHADISMTMRYAHPTPETRRAAVDGLPRPDRTSIVTRNIASAQ